MHPANSWKDMSRLAQGGGKQPPTPPPVFFFFFASVEEHASEMKVFGAMERKTDWEAQQWQEGAHAQ